MVDRDELSSLLDDFISETAEHLSAAEERLLRLEENPGDPTLAREMLRAFHTIKGNSAYFDFREMAELAHRLESLLMPVQEGLSPLDPAGMNTLLAGIDRMRALLRDITAGHKTTGVGRDETTLPEGAQGSPDDWESDGRHLLFEVNGTRMALPLAQVIEVTRPAPVTPLPHVPPYVAGLVNLRGMVVPLVDLKYRLWGEPGLDTAQHLVVVPAGSGRVALAVERVAAVKALDLEGAVGFVSGKPVSLLDLASVLRHREGEDVCCTN